jgi:hypothetical protein
MLRRILVVAFQPLSDETMICKSLCGPLCVSVCVYYTSDRSRAGGLNNRMKYIEKLVFL